MDPSSATSGPYLPDAGEPASASNIVAWDALRARVGVVAAGVVIATSLAVLTVYAVQHAWLCDDAFISFRYARNLVNGHGLVFNVGERVEGYTNFLWVLELAAIWKWFGVVPEHSSYALSVLYTVGTLVVTARLAWSTPRHNRRWITLAATLFLLAINRNVAVWTTSGLETRQFTFFVLLAILWLQRKDTRDAFGTFVPASLAWAMAELTRPEAMLLAGCGGLWLLGGQIARRRIQWRALAGYAVPFAVVVGVHYLWRYSYYGDWFPNTYYAKDVRPWFEAGWHYLTVAAIESGWIVVLPVSALGLWARLVWARDGLHVLSALCVVFHAAYLIRIGGDHFELRPLDFYWPLLALATVDGVLWLQEWFASRVAGRLAQRLAGRSAVFARSFAAPTGWLVTSLFALTVVFYSVALQLAHRERIRGLKTRNETYLLYPDLRPDVFKAAFLLPGMDALVALYNRAHKFCSGHSVGTRHVEHRAFWKSQSNAYGPYINRTKGLFPPDAVMSLGTIGVASYALEDLTIIDSHGLTDRTVAHNPVIRDNDERQLAHDRQPPPGYLKERGVNLEVVASRTRFGPESDYALRLDDKVWMHLISAQADWLRTAFQGRGLWVKRLRTKLERNEVWIEGKAMTPVRALGFFDRNTLQGWTVEGDAMDEQPRGLTTAGQSDARGVVGAGFINTFHPTLGDRAKGTALSPTFVPQADQVLVFVVGGGKDPAVGVQLLVDGDVVATWRGDDSENLALVTHDLRDAVGRTCQLRVVDDSAGAWAHVLADHFFLARPAQ